MGQVYLALRHPSSRPGHVDLMSASLVLVGVTSFVYHATLRQTTQLSDDLSMLLLAGALLRTLYCAGQPPGRVTLTTVTIYAVISAMSGFYVNNGNVLVHTAMFAGMLNLIWPRTLYLISRRERSAQEKAGYYERFRKACAVLALAFAVWVIDLERCQELRNLRKALGLPWAWLFELHGWWHILTAIGAALYMELIRDISK